MSPILVKTFGPFRFLLVPIRPDLWIWKIGIWKLSAASIFEGMFMMSPGFFVTPEDALKDMTEVFKNVMEPLLIQTLTVSDFVAVE